MIGTVVFLGFIIFIGWAIRKIIITHQEIKELEDKLTGK